MFRSLSNKIAAAAVGITMTIVLALGGISYQFTRWSVQAQIQQRLAFEASLLQNRLETILTNINHEAKSLSENLVIVNALIDSQGRDVYVKPFIHDLRLPYDLEFNLILCDFEGKTVIAKQPAGHSYPERTLLAEVIEGKQAFAEIRQSGNQPHLLLAYPIIYSYTGLPEGMLILEVPVAAIVIKTLETDFESANWSLAMIAGERQIWTSSAAPPQFHPIFLPFNLPAPLDGLDLAIRFAELNDIANEPLWNLTILYLLMAVAVLLITFILSRFMAYRLTLPLKQLTETADNISRTGIPHTPINIASDDEVKILTDSFNTMLDSLREAQSSLEKRVRERTRELERLNRKTENYAEALQVLLHEVNHRVKNNLTAIISMLHQEEDRALSEGTPGGVEAAARIKEVVGRISGLLTVHSLLSSSKWQPVSLDRLAAKIVQEVIKVGATGDPVSLRVSPSDIHLNSDQAHFLAIVLNELATNTLKYAIKAKGKAHIKIDIEPIGPNIIIIYQDDGPGYPDYILHGDIPKRCIGYRLISGIITRSLQGKLELFNENGAMARIMFPALDLSKDP